ncbi:hypothetical protein VOLCADRAFT_118666 [Volvox carteri f. nagariensis]|uniref:Uncharacterized protein n=1 Tax=Volvox carteri f. nagariensis TaxID=3068 RepID=D8U6J3_VOLCA|nr:uncharacterized protein VOLCADRAFT_118666 [Volvox carteri f. nagariensis]EFJ44724.1 hypothetical protein VOLCADRAFT_118666 [Volvox carteri f. nagariensis]|eukprot:XP_002954300.1 hypothetical protein VOLCADRAFT_118666 [Volvox carteri f. nagariensis]
MENGEHKRKRKRSRSKGGPSEGPGGAGTDAGPLPKQGTKPQVSTPGVRQSKALQQNGKSAQPQRPSSAPVGKAAAKGKSPQQPGAAKQQIAPAAKVITSMFWLSWIR